MNHEIEGSIQIDAIHILMSLRKRIGELGN